MIAKAATAAKPLLLAPATMSTSVAVDQAARAPKAVSEAFAALSSDDDDEGSYDDGTYERVTKAPGYGDEGCF